MKGSGFLFLVYVELTSGQPWVLSKREGVLPKDVQHIDPQYAPEWIVRENKTQKIIAEGGFIEERTGSHH